MSSLTHPPYVWLIDDNEPFRVVIEEFLKNHSAIHVRCFESCSCALGLLKSRHCAPDVILLDVQLEETNGLDFIPSFRQFAPDSKIVILTSFPTRENIAKALSSGASGFLEKGSNTLTKLISCIEDAIQGLMVLDKIATKEVLELFETHSSSITQYDITNREQEALSYFVRGLTIEQTAEMMHVSPHTVHTYDDALLKKLNVHNRAALVVKAIKERLV